jgi:hypothetical protein
MANDPRDTDTVRDLPRPERQIRDTVPEQQGVYFAPRPLAPTSDHRTIQIRPGLLASHVDPRRAPTELRLSAPPAPSRPLRYLIPLAVLAVAAGAFLAAHLTEGPAGASSPSSPRAPEAAQRSQVAAPAPLVVTPGATVQARSTPAPATASPSASAAPRKKTRDPWLD